jgi:hypothetical protein
MLHEQRIAELGDCEDVLARSLNNTGLQNLCATSVPAVQEGNTVEHVLLPFEGFVAGSDGAFPHFQRTSGKEVRVNNGREKYVMVSVSAPFLIFNRFQTYATGSRWVEIGPTAPANGKELTNPALSDALKTKKTFTGADMAIFGITKLEQADYIKSDVSYFQLDVLTDEIDCPAENIGLYTLCAAVVYEKVHFRAYIKATSEDATATWFHMDTNSKVSEDLPKKANFRIFMYTLVRETSLPSETLYPRRTQYDRPLTDINSCYLNAAAHVFAVLWNCLKHEVVPVRHSPQHVA